MSALALTGRDLSAALARGLSMADRRAAERAAQLAEAMGAGLGADGRVDVALVAPGDYRVSAAAPGLFGREFGTAERPADSAIGPAVDQLKTAGTSS